MCTICGRKGKRIYRLNMYRKHIDVPRLARAVLEQRQRFGAGVILV